MTSVFSWQNSASLCPASFCTPRPNLPVTPGICFPIFEFQSPVLKNPSFWSVSSSVVSDSVRPHRRQPTRLRRPWDSLGKNTRVGCHFLLQCMKVKSESEVAQSCPTQRPHGLKPTRLLQPWDFPGKSTGVGCHCLLHLGSLVASKYVF